MNMKVKFLVIKPDCADTLKEYYHSMMDTMVPRSLLRRITMLAESLPIDLRFRISNLQRKPISPNEQSVCQELTMVTPVALGTIDVL